MGSRSTKIIPSHSKRRSRALRRGRCPPPAVLGPVQSEPAAIPTDTIRSGRCGRPRQPVNNPLMPWFEAIDQPGAGQMQFGRKLLESRPFLRVPDDTVIVTDRVATQYSRGRTKRFVATRDAEGSFALVYCPTGRAIQVRMDAIKGSRSRRGGSIRGRRGHGDRPVRNRGQRFLPPDAGEMIDWVLVLDDASKELAKPGIRPASGRVASRRLPDHSSRTGAAQDQRIESARVLVPPRPFRAAAPGGNTGDRTSSCCGPARIRRRVPFRTRTSRTWAARTSVRSIVRYFVTHGQDLHASGVWRGVGGQ